MKKFTIAAIAAMCICLALLCIASATDATSTWDSAAHAYGFQTTSEAGAFATFHDANTGPEGNFAGRFAAIKSYVGSVCGNPIMDPSGDDVMSARLANW